MPPATDTPVAKPAAVNTNPTAALPLDDDVIHISPTDAMAAAALEAIRNDCSTPPPFPTLSRWTLVEDDDLIPYDDSAFTVLRDCVTICGNGTMEVNSAGVQAKS